MLIKKFNDNFSRFHTILECDGQTGVDGEYRPLHTVVRQKKTKTTAQTCKYKQYKMYIKSDVQNSV